MITGDRDRYLSRRGFLRGIAVFPPVMALATLGVARSPLMGWESAQSPDDNVELELRTDVLSMEAGTTAQFNIWANDAVDNGWFKWKVELAGDVPSWASLTRPPAGYEMWKPWLLASNPSQGRYVFRYKVKATYNDGDHEAYGNIELTVTPAKPEPPANPPEQNNRLFIPSIQR